LGRSLDFGFIDRLLLPIDREKINNLKFQDSAALRLVSVRATGRSPLQTQYGKGEMKKERGGASDIAGMRPSEGIGESR